jgi:hypothetical protein
MTTTNEAWAIRPHEPADLPFIVDSWVKSYWDAINRDPWPLTHTQDGPEGVVGKRLNRNHFYTPGQREYAAFCIAAHGCQVAHVIGDPDKLMGFACGSLGVLHYVYVKSAFRRIGVGLALTRAAVGDDGPVIVSHLTGHVDRVLRAREWRHEPNWEIKK